MPTPREKEILNLIKANPLITQKELAAKLGISRPGVASHISRLIKAGLISGKGYILPQENYVTVIGAVNMDVYGILKTAMPVAKGSNAGHITTQLGGVGRNVAANLAQLGVNTNFVTVYGNDQNGQTFKTDALQRGINIAYSQQVMDEKTAVYLYINRPNGERYIGLDDMEINHHLSPQFLQRALASINQSQSVIIDSNLPVASIRWLYDHVQVPMFAKAVSVDKASNLLQDNTQLNGLVINGVEGSRISNIDIHDRYEAVRAAARLYQQFSSPIYLYVDDEGIFYQDQEVQRFQPYLSQQRKLNTNGVGAAMVAVIAYAKIQAADVNHTLQMIAKSSALTMATNQSVSKQINSKQIH